MSAYDKIVTEAVDDILLNGYDSPQRILHWARQIGFAAKDFFGESDSGASRLRSALESTYRKAQGSAGRRHKGISPSALERAKGGLRTDLERRILAATTLVELHREESIDRTVRRFVGWSTSVPAGGGVGSRLEARRPLTDLEFDDARLIADQRAKLEASMDLRIAEVGGAIAGHWRSNWRSPGYDYREDHKHRDERFYLIRGSWALQEGLLKKAGQPYTDEIEAPSEWAHCRCYYIYIYDLRDIPEMFLTAKGRAFIAGERSKLPRGR